MKNEKKLFLDLDGTVAKFNVRNALKRYATEIGFFANLGAYKGTDYLNRLAKKNKNIYIISASPNEQADKDKMEWIKKHLGNIDTKNIVLCRLGENKAEVIKNKLNIAIDNTCYLLDDYTKNLKEWEQVGGVGIKRITSVADNSTKKWQGLTLKQLTKLEGVMA